MSNHGYRSYLVVMNPSLPPLGTEQELFATITDAAAWLQRRLDGGLSIAGLTYGEYRLLRAIADAPGRRISRVDLAGLVGLTASGVTRALRPLEKLGYVETARDQRDARRALASLTTAGEELARNASGIVDDTCRSVLDGAPEFRERLELLRSPLAELVRS